MEIREIDRLKISKTPRFVSALWLTQGLKNLPNHGGNGLNESGINRLNELKQILVENCRQEHKKLIGRYDSTNKRFPVIVDTYMAGLGVQFWTNAEVKKGILINTDRSTSTFIEKL